MTSIADTINLALYDAPICYISIEVYRVLDTGVFFETPFTIIKEELLNA